MSVLAGILGGWGGSQRAGASFGRVSSGQKTNRRGLGSVRTELTGLRASASRSAGDAEGFQWFVVFDSARDIAEAARVVADTLYSTLDYGISSHCCSPALALQRRRGSTRSRRRRRRGDGGEPAGVIAQ